jgi:hypothetical protein
MMLQWLISLIVFNSYLIACDCGRKLYTSTFLWKNNCSRIFTTSWFCHQMMQSIDWCWCLQYWMQLGAYNCLIDSCLWLMWVFFCMNDLCQLLMYSKLITLYVVIQNYQKEAQGETMARGKKFLRPSYSILGWSWMQNKYSMLEFLSKTPYNSFTSLSL